MNEAEDTYASLVAEIKIGGARLVAVSKTKPAEAILSLYERGQRVFGENKAQELSEKYEALPKDIEWHFIGHLQTNKVRTIAPFVSLVHSIDSERLIIEIDQQARKQGRIIKGLLQFKIAAEDTKQGADFEEMYTFLHSPTFKALENVEIVGVMGMATFTEDLCQVRSEFRHLKAMFDKLKESPFREQHSFKEISMGMSDDYRVALEEGSTLVRIGSLLFGRR